MLAAYGNVIKYVSIVILGGLVFGLDAGIIAGIIGFARAEFALDDLQVGMLVAAPALGAIFALAICGRIVNTFGRKKTLMGIAFLYLVSAIASTFAPNYHFLVMARLLGGMAFCSLSTTALYTGELAPSKVRGKLIAFNQVLVGIGFFAAHSVNYWFIQLVDDSSFFFNTHNVWRSMFAVEIPLALMWFLLLFRIPESPRWLMYKDRVEEAKKIIENVNRPEDVKEVIEGIKDSIAKAACNTTTTHQFKLFFSPKMRKVLLLGLGLNFIQTSSGADAISYYSPIIFQQVGLGQDSAFMQAAILGLLGVIMSLAAVSVVDKFGRKPIYLTGLSVIAISLLTMSYSFHKAEYKFTDENIAKIEDIISDEAALEDVRGMTLTSDKEFKQVARALFEQRDYDLYEGRIFSAFIEINALAVVIAIYAFKAAYYFSLGALMWVLLSEITPNAIRSAAIPFFSMMTSVFAFCVQKYFPVVLSQAGAAGTFMFFATCACLGVLFITLFVPETKNKSLEEIESLVTRKSKRLEYANAAD
ncbi:MFS transporter [Vibrio sp. WXL103]|uniref:MFS transporter n=1 Tax=unclassified Vibrio TaxID=2614977 RepID=UPI003EC5A7F0